MRHRTAEDEAARFDTGHLVDLRPGPGLHHFIHRPAEGARIAQKRGDVAKDDPGLGIVRDAADGGFQVVFKFGLGHDGIRVEDLAEGLTLANDTANRNRRTVSWTIPPSALSSWTCASRFFVWCFSS